MGTQTLATDAMEDAAKRQATHAQANLLHAQQCAETASMWGVKRVMT